MGILKGLEAYVFEEMKDMQICFIDIGYAFDTVTPVCFVWRIARAILCFVEDLADNEVRHHRSQDVLKCCRQLEDVVFQD